MSGHVNNLSFNCPVWSEKGDESETLVQEQIQTIHKRKNIASQTEPTYKVQSVHQLIIR